MNDGEVLEQRIDDTFAQDRLRTSLVVLFAITALSLASVGLYGTLSYTASLRRREVGLRLALGAMRGVIVRQLVSGSPVLVGVACAGGIALSARRGKLDSLGATDIDGDFQLGD